MRYHTINGGNITDFLNVSRFLILSGTGGLGKSMMLRNLLLASANRYEEIGLIPFFIPVKDYSPSSLSMFDHIFTTANSLWPELTQEGLEFLLGEGKALLLFDGLDELHSSILTDFTRKMNWFLDRYPNNAFILSSRPYSNFHSFASFTILYLQPFTLDQTLEMIDRYNYRSDSPKMQAQFRFQLEHVYFMDHKEFCTNPLLLSIMMLIYELDGEIPVLKHQLYQEAYTVLSRRHDAIKDGYNRMLETGWNANQFADYLAVFSAMVYCDGLVSLSYSQMDQYFRKIVRKYHISGVTLDAFIYDLLNNLCLMRQDGLQYVFIHRSFQEYFCAKYFALQLDDHLTRVIPVFDRDDRTKKCDTALEMLFEMKPKAVEKYMIVPYLKELFKDCESKDGIWTFLGRLYDGYELADGDAWVEDDNCQPRSNLYAFILKKYDIPLLMPIASSFPNIDCFTLDTLVYREDTKQDDWEKNLPSDYEENYGEPEVTGHIYSIRWNTVLEEYQYYPSNLEGFIPAVENPESAFMAEYNAVKKLLSELESKIAEKPVTDDLFDLLD